MAFGNPTIDLLVHPAFGGVPGAPARRWEATDLYEDYKRLLRIGARRLRLSQRQQTFRYLFVAIATLIAFGFGFRDDL